MATQLAQAHASTKVQSQYLVKLRAELADLRVTFKGFEAAMTLHGLMDVRSLLKIVTTSTMKPSDVQTAIAALESDATARMPTLLEEVRASICM